MDDFSIRTQMTVANDLLIDRIYEAALMPELWAGTCDLISDSIGAYSTALLSVELDGTVRFTSSDCIAAEMVRYQESGLALRNRRPLLGLEMAPGSFLRDIDLMSLEDLENDPLSVELLRPLGFAWEMGAAIREPSGSFMVYSMLGRTENGPFSIQARDKMNALKPHLARASLMSTKLAFERSLSITQMLSLLGLPAAVIGDNGKVVAMNDEMNGFGSRVSTRLGDKIVITNADANALIEDALSRFRLGLAPTVQSIPVIASETAPALILHLLPIKRNAMDAFSKGKVILIATPVGEVGPPDLRVICGLFDLTRSEARISQLIATGFSIEEVAVKLDISRETVRTHLRAIFRKTGVRRQAELVSLMSGLPTLRV